MLSFGFGHAQAQDEDLDALIERGRALSKADKPDQALSYFLLALEMAEARHGADSAAIVPMLEDLAELHAGQRQYGDAEPLYDRSLRIQERALARSQAAIARTLTSLASIYEATERATKARAVYERVLTLWAAALGPDDPSVRIARERLTVLAEGLAPALPEVAPARPPPPGYRIHLTSIRDPRDAEAEWRRLKRLYGALLDGLELSVTRVDLGAPRGVYHRIMGAALSMPDARARCAAFAARGAWCRVVRPAPGAPPAPPVMVEREPPAPAEIAPGAGFFVHLTSIRNPSHAEAEWARLKRIYRSLLKDLRLAVERADLGPEKGVYYRIEGGPLTHEAARALCAAFAARNIWCRVARPLDQSAEWLQRQVVQRVRRRIPPPSGTRRPGRARRRARAPRPRPQDRGCRRRPECATGVRRRGT